MTGLCSLCLFFDRGVVIDPIEIVKVIRLHCELLSEGSGPTPRHGRQHSALKVGSLRISSTILTCLLLGIRTTAWLEQAAQRVVPAMLTNLWESTLGLVCICIYGLLWQIELKCRRLGEEISKAILDRVSGLNLTPLCDCFHTLLPLSAIVSIGKG